MLYEWHGLLLRLDRRHLLRNSILPGWADMLPHGHHPVLRSPRQRLLRHHVLLGGRVLLRQRMLR
jgi:hypothetical protein